MEEGFQWLSKFLQDALLCTLKHILKSEYQKILSLCERKMLLLTPYTPQGSRTDFQAAANQNQSTEPNLHGLCFETELAA